MKIVSYVIPAPFDNNALFEALDSKLNRDDCLRPYRVLKRRFADVGYDLSTSDINLPADSDIVIYHNMPRNMPDPGTQDRSYLRITESAVVRPDNWCPKKHRLFRRVFTWNDEWVDNKRYFKLNYPQVPPKVTAANRREQKLCCLIAANKNSKHPNELYSARLSTIKWFERNHPNDFDLFGSRWDRHVFAGAFAKLNGIDALAKGLSSSRPSYRGGIESKHNTLQRYRFSVCYENASGFPGYITEKLFDCLFAGVVPIYWGAPNVRRHVPSECFIDRRAFDSHEALYEYMVRMDARTYSTYLSEASNFLESDAYKAFDADYIADRIVELTTT